MAKDRDIFDEELSEADRLLLKLYDESKEPIKWDASDDAVLAFSRQISLPGEQSAPGAGSEGQEEEDLGANVVRFPSRNIVRRIVQSPGISFAIAASVVVGLFVGQGLTPYLNLGVAPDYSTVLAENDRLQSSVDRLGSDLTIMRTRIEITDDGASGVPSPQAAAAGPGLAGLASVLGQFECAALSATLQKNARLVVTGHVSSAADLDQLSRDLADYGQNGAVLNQAEVFGWPHCEAAEILHGFTLLDRNLSGAPTVRPFNHSGLYRQGENMEIEVIAPVDAAAFIYVDFVQQDGTVVHLLPTDDDAENQLDAGARLVLGQGAQRYRVEPPFGTEMMMVVASPVPLFDGGRAQVEPAQEYLGALRAALSRARDAGHGAGLRSDFSFLVTEAGQ
ncbi:MAG: DUF4384 domain-containing protein [Alphaproteobacteria bacterium]